MKITYYGHSCFSVLAGGKHLLFDPFISGNDLAKGVAIGDILADYIFVSHGHFDHLLDVVDIANRTRAVVVGKLLALEVSSRITSADQKCFEIPGTEDEGIDMELEFTNDDGKGTGKRLYLQLKSGNSHLKKRKDGTEIFTIREQRWVEYWIAQKEPVMLVIGTFSEDVSVEKEKLEFSEVRWMEISSVLKRESQNGTKPVKQIEFKGERLDMSSVRRRRDEFLF